MGFEERLERAKTSYRNGRYAEAVRELEGLLREKPEQVVWLMLARAYEKNGQPSEAVLAYRSILDSNASPVLEQARQGLVALSRKGLIPVDAIQAWCRQTTSAVSFRIEDDSFWLDGNHLRLGTSEGPFLDPRVPFPIEGGVPVLREEILSSFEGGHFEVVDPNETSILPFAAFWETLLPMGWLAISDSPAFLLYRSGGIRREALVRAMVERKENETLGAALVRLDLIPLDALVQAALGKRPTGYCRPFGERIGSRIARQGKQALVKQALTEQAQRHQPLGKLMLDRGLSPSLLQAALAEQSPLRPVLAEEDSPAECLVRWGLLSRTALLEARAKKKPLPVKPEAIKRAQLYARELSTLLAKGQRRIGSLLVNRGFLSREDLGKALAWQVDQPYPLGELLVQRRLCSPEALIELLKEQLEDYREEAELGLPPLPEAEEAEEAEKIEKPDEETSKRKIALWVGLGLVSAIALALTLKPYIPLPWLRGVEREKPTWFNWWEGARGRLGVGTDPQQPGESDGLNPDPLSLPGEASGSYSNEYRPEALGGSLDPRTIDGTPPAPSFEPQASGYAPNPSLVLASPEYSPSAPGHVQRTEFNAPSPAGSWVDGALPSPPAAQSNFGTVQGMSEKQGGNLPVKLEKPGRSGVPLLNAILSQEKSLGLFSSQYDGKAEPWRELGDQEVQRSSAMFRLRLGEALHAKKDDSSAAEEYLAALSSDPSLPLPYFRLGQMLEKAGEKRRAREHFERYLKLAPTSEFADEARDRLKKLRR